MVNLEKNRPNKPNIMVFMSINKINTRIPPMVFVRKILFRLIGFDMTKSTLFFLNIKPKSEIDKTIGIIYKPR